MTAAVHARELFYLYRAPHGDVPALRGLSLDVASREVVSVLGPSGSGKTTLLALCAGFARPSSGELAVLDRPAPELARLRRCEIGIVRQHYHRALPRELTVEEIVALPVRLLGARPPAARARARGLLDVAGLSGRRASRPVELSGGEQQRVAVCAALAKRPALLLADEPTGELDPRNSALVVDLLLELAHDSGTAALIVTHDPEVALRTERTIHIRDGRLAAEGTTRPVLIVDEQGWLRLPRRLRDEAGVRDRVRAQASWGKVELFADDPEARAERPAVKLSAPAKRFETEVALDRIAKRYGAQDEAVLTDLSWTCAPEQLHVVAGPSGSGKTTVLNLVAGLDYPDRGEIWVGGERVDSLSPDDAARWRRRTVGYVSQHSTLTDFLTARENVELALALRGFDESESTRRAERWLEWVGLEGLANRRADHLSGGEQRRVALARALAPEPRLLLADEPTAHLDRVTGRIVIRLLQEAAHDGGTTVLAAGHDPDLVSSGDTRLLLGSNEALQPTPTRVERAADFSTAARDSGILAGRCVPTECRKEDRHAQPDAAVVPRPSPTQVRAAPAWSRLMNWKELSMGIPYRARVNERWFLNLSGFHGGEYVVAYARTRASAVLGDAPTATTTTTRLRTTSSRGRSSRSRTATTASISSSTSTRKRVAPTRCTSSTR